MSEKFVVYAIKPILSMYTTDKAFSIHFRHGDGYTDSMIFYAADELAAFRKCKEHMKYGEVVLESSYE
jgi:hypothetical protein